MKKAMVTTSMIYFILGGTILFINVLTYAEVPQYLITVVEKIRLSQNQLILIMLGLLLVLDLMMEPVPMLFLVVPLTSKVIFSSGIHWITFNFLLLQYSAVAFITPPLAMALFVMAQMFHARIEDVAKGVLPFLAILITSIMAVGAIFGAVNTMYAAVSSRMPEIAVLLTLGFRPRSVLASFLIESALVAAIGGIVGCLLALPLNGLVTSTTNWASFSEIAFAFRITPRLLLAGLVFAVVMGMLGGFFPARRASRVPVVQALR
jgi:hypothetical protein